LYQKFSDDFINYLQDTYLPSLQLNYDVIKVRFLDFVRMIINQNIFSLKTVIESIKSNNHKSYKQIRELMKKK
jgi:hypothetical protein